MMQGRGNNWSALVSRKKYSQLSAYVVTAVYSTTLLECAQEQIVSPYFEPYISEKFIYQYKLSHQQISSFVDLPRFVWLAVQGQIKHEAGSKIDFQSNVPQTLNQLTNSSA